MRLWFSDLDRRLLSVWRPVRAAPTEFSGSAMRLRGSYHPPAPGISRQYCRIFPLASAVLQIELAKKLQKNPGQAAHPSGRRHHSTRFEKRNPFPLNMGPAEATLAPRKPSKVTISEGRYTPHVWTAPSWQELSSRMQHWSVRPCVRPLSAVHMTAGRDLISDVASNT